MYKPPGDTLLDTDLDSLLQAPGTTIGGDLNAKHPSWGSRLTNPAGRALRHFSSAHPHINVCGPEDATFLPSDINRRGDVLDIFVTNFRGGLLDVQTVHELSSDHFPVLAVLSSSRILPVAVTEALTSSCTTWVPNANNHLGLSPEEKRLVQRKNAAKRRFSRFHDPRNKLIYSRLQGKVTLMLQRRKDENSPPNSRLLPLLILPQVVKYSAAWRLSTR